MLTDVLSRPSGRRGLEVAEIAAALGRRLGVERRGYPDGERFLVALTHDVDLLGAGGARTAARRLAGGVVHRSRRRLQESMAFAGDALRGRDPAYPLDAMLDAEEGRGSTCFFLTRQEDPHDGYPERYGPAFARAVERTRAAGLEVGAARLVPGQRAAGRDRGGGGAAPRRTRPEAPLPA